MPDQTKPTDPIRILPVMYNKMYMYLSVSWIQVISRRIRVDFYLLVERVLTKGNIFNSARKNKYKNFDTKTINSWIRPNRLIQLAFFQSCIIFYFHSHFILIVLSHKYF